MIELSGKYNTAKVFTDVVDAESISQVIQLLNQPMAEGSRIRMMPDIHAGAGCTIGTTMTVTDKIIPNLVGVDIGCGVQVAKLRETELDPKELDEVIHERIPSGFDKRPVHHRYAGQIDLKELRCASFIDIENAKASIGTLGGGNHFIEADRDDSGHVYIVVHSGSRHLGLEVAKYYQNAAFEKLTGADKESIEKAKEAVIAQLKAEHRERDIEKALRNLQKPAVSGILKDLAYCEGRLMEDYVHDMKIIQQFAVLNRKAIIDEIMTCMSLHAEEEFTTIHNYLDTENMILRKGAVSAQAGEKLIIPINMRDGSLICVGKGDPDWNFSAPHGAGRLMSRSKAKDTFTVEAFADEMKGIYSTSINRSTLDECPMAYKGMDAIADNIGPTADIIDVIKPIYNYKAGEDD